MRSSAATRHGMARWRGYRLSVTVTAALLGGPVLAGLTGTLLPAFGYMPALGQHQWSLQPWHELAAWPGFRTSVALTATTGLVATILSLAAALLIVAALHGTRAFGWVGRVLAPLLAIPHAATAFALAFLIAPSGWVFRFAAPLTGWERPPDVLTVNDPAGVALVAGLVLKEVPFLLFMVLAALPQTDAAQALPVARSLGYGRVMAFAKVALPGIWPQVRLPVCAVLAYSMSVVDMALILGPTRPPTLAVQVVTWMSSPDLSLRAVAAAGAVVIAAMVGASVALGAIAIHLVTPMLRIWAEAGARGRGGNDLALRALAWALAAACAFPLAVGASGLVLWSVAGPWQFPAMLPTALDGRAWASQTASLGVAAGSGLAIALVAAAVALILVLGSLQAEARARTPLPVWWRGLVFIPLVVPEVAFLPGLQILALSAGLDGGFAVVVLGHLVFVLPYVWLVLADPWRAWDARAGIAAATLGAAPRRIFWSVRLPMLARPVCAAAGVGLAVSAALYLPTLVLGGGRVVTLTTEAVALYAGGNRRLIGVWAVAQMLLPALAFAVALGVPSLLHRNRRAIEP